MQGVGYPWEIEFDFQKKKITLVAEMSSSNAIVKHCQGHTVCRSGSYIERIHMLS